MDMQFNMLELSKYDPEKDIILVYVNTGKMQGRRQVNDYLAKIKEIINPSFKKRGFETFYIPVQHKPNSLGSTTLVFSINSMEELTKQAEELEDYLINKYDNSMKNLFND